MLTIVFTDDRLPKVEVRWREDDRATFVMLYDGEVVDRYRSFEADQRPISLGRVAEIAEDRIDVIINAAQGLGLKVEVDEARER